MVYDYSVLRADRPTLVASHASSDLRSPCGSFGSFDEATHVLGQSGTKDRESQLAIAMLRTLGLYPYTKSARTVRELHGTLRLVPMLTTGPGAPTHLPLEVALPDVDLRSAPFLQHGHGHRARVHAAVLLVRGDPLPSMATGFVCEYSPCVAAVHQEGSEAGGGLDRFDAKDTSVGQASRRSRTAPRQVPLRQLHLPLRGSPPEWSCCFSLRLACTEGHGFTRRQLHPMGMNRWPKCQALS